MKALSAEMLAKHPANTVFRNLSTTGTLGRLRFGCGRLSSTLQLGHLCINCKLSPQPPHSNNTFLWTVQFSWTQSLDSGGGEP